MILKERLSIGVSPATHRSHNATSPKARTRRQALFVAIVASATLAAPLKSVAVETQSDENAASAKHPAIHKHRKKAARAVDRAPPPDAVTPSHRPLLSAPGQFPDPLDKVAGEGPLTWKGITLYGTVDAGVSYMAHGMPFNGYAGWPNSMIQKSSNKAGFETAPNGLSMSSIGLKGDLPIAGDVSAVFNAATAFNPFSGQLVNGPQTLVQQAGVPQAAQSTNGDSSRAGQALNSYYYAGLSSKEFGTLTYGRQYSLLLDTIIDFDPAGGSQDFSPIGFSGVPGGGGDTEDGRIDNTIKYRLTQDLFNFGALYKFGSNDPLQPHDEYQLDGGVTFNNLSLEGVFSQANGAVSASALSAAQAATPTYTNYYGAALPTNGTLAATISDNTAFMFAAKYTWDRFKFFAGYEHIQYANPEHPIGAGYATIGGYQLSFVNNDAFPRDKILQIMWIGTKYALTDYLDLTAGYYHYIQDAYYTTYPTTGCHGTSAASTCAGTEDAISFYADYRLTHRAELYAGLMYSTVANGMASHYLNTYNVNPTVGFRYQF
jgi:predicted porin